jgi:hypothetical protein
MGEADAAGLSVVSLEEIRQHAGKPRMRHAAPWAREKKP